MNPVKQVCGYSFFQQRLKNLDHLALRSDHADIAGARLHGPAQDAHVVAMAASDDDDVGSLVRFELLDSLVEIQRMNFASGGKAFLGRVGGSVVGNDGVKTGIGCRLTKIGSNVTCAEYIK